MKSGLLKYINTYISQHFKILGKSVSLLFTWYQSQVRLQVRILVEVFS